MKSPFKYINNFNYAPRQRLLENMSIEAIKKNGFVLKYIPRDGVDRDDLYGEDPYNRFDLAIEIEAYIKNIDSFSGQGDILTRIGFIVNDQITFTIARRRFDEVREELLISENDYVYQQEHVNLSAPYESDGFLLEDGNKEGYSIDFDRPRAGDLIYFAMVDKIFEITHVEHESMFYQFGKLMTWDLQCELFKYSSDEFDTAHPEIDIVEDLYNLDMNREVYLHEDGEPIQIDGGGYLTLETYRIEDFDTTANNELLQDKAEDLINFGEKSPLIQTNKW